MIAAVAAGVVGAVLVARAALRRHDRKLRAGVFDYLRWTQNEWVRGADLHQRFGGGVHHVIRDLADDGILERREGPSTMAEMVARGGRPVVWYRLNTMRARP